MSLQMQKVMKMDIVSNGVIPQSEFDYFVKMENRAGGELPRRSQLEELEVKLIAAEDYRYTATEVKKILEERREQGKAAPNLTFEKNRLQVSGWSYHRISRQTWTLVACLRARERAKSHRKSCLSTTVSRTLHSLFASRARLFSRAEVPRLTNAAEKRNVESRGMGLESSRRLPPAEYRAGGRAHTPS